jgi:hypothetical protein
MNRVGAAASTSSANTYTRLYTHIMLYCIYTVYILCMYKRLCVRVRTQINTSINNDLYIIAQNNLHVLT